MCISHLQHHLDPHLPLLHFRGRPAAHYTIASSRERKAPRPSPSEAVMTRLYVAVSCEVPSHHHLTGLTAQPTHATRRCICKPSVMRSVTAVTVARSGSPAVEPSPSLAPSCSPRLLHDPGGSWHAYCSAYSSRRWLRAPLTPCGASTLMISYKRYMRSYVSSVLLPPDSERQIKACSAASERAPPGSPAVALACISCAGPTFIRYLTGQHEA